MRRRVQIIANQIVIKLSSNSFFREFGNIFKIGHWTKVRKKTSVIGKTLQRNGSLRNNYVV